LTVPTTTTPARNDFGPQASLAYDSGPGKGPIGFGWRLSVPFITRNIDKWLPRILYGEESNAFILAGFEDLGLAFQSLSTVHGENTAPPSVGANVMQQNKRKGS
jgi:virulence plasmid B protein